jgi:hypothetical protein
MRYILNFMGISFMILGYIAAYNHSSKILIYSSLLIGVGFLWVYEQLLIKECKK